MNSVYCEYNVNIMHVSGVNRNNAESAALCWSIQGGNINMSVGIDTLMAPFLH